MEQEKLPMAFYATTCCAMMIASLKDYHSLAEIKGRVEHFKREAYSRSWAGEDNRAGQRNMLVIVSPGEVNLERNLIALKFQLLTDKMPRRVGYPKGTLKMYMLSW